MMNDVAGRHGAAAERTPDGVDWDTAARVVRLLAVVQQFAVLDFADAAPVGEAGDDLDALAAGVNMLGEELAGWHADFVVRVDQRTVELTASSARLEAQIAQRRRIEEQLTGTNAELEGRVEQLRRSNEQIGQLAEMLGQLQLAHDLDEAFGALGRLAPRIFAEVGGAVYRGSRDALERVATWGPQRALPTRIGSGRCMALRRGRTPAARGNVESRCRHFAPDVPDRTLCIPLTVDDETLGMLSLNCPPSLSIQAAAGQHASNQDVRFNIERLAVAASVQFTLSLTNLALREELRDQSIRDVLTGLHNRRYLDETLARELHRADRADTAVSVLMLDIDHFKDFNDTFGHAAGDAVLSHLGGVLLECIRAEDVVCRFGGEEFAVVMAGIGQREAARRAEQIRTSVAESSFRWADRPTGGLTVSIGVATRPQHGTTADRLLAAADAAMYRAKAEGRNRVEDAR